MRLVVRVTLATLVLGAVWTVADPPATGAVLRLALFTVLAAVAAALGLALRRQYPAAPVTPLDRPPPAAAPLALPLDLRDALVELRTATAGDERIGARSLRIRVQRLAADRARSDPAVRDFLDRDGRPDRATIESMLDALERS
jgi:hypothetical protein